MTPVMERCPCSWPLAECLEHAPGPDTSGLVLDGPPPVVVTGAVAATGAAAVVVVAGMAVVAWALGVVIDVLRGEA